MPVYMELLDLNEEFKKADSKIIINDLPARTEADIEYFHSLIRKTYDSDIISVIPRCECPDDNGLQGEHLIGEICDICGTAVKPAIDADIHPILWFRSPEGVAPLMNPAIWLMLSDRFSKSKYRVLQWLTDRHYRPGNKEPEVIEKLRQAGFQRGYNAFYERFDEIMAFLFSQPEFSKKRNDWKFVIGMLKTTEPHLPSLEDPALDPLYELIKHYRDRIFSRYIPLPNRCMLVMVKSATGTYAEESTFDIINVLNTMLSIDRDHYDKSAASVENRTARILSMLVSYIQKVFKTNMTGKSALPRKHLYAGRGNFTFRCVITSHPEIHRHDEIHMPWGAACGVFQLHIIPRLMRGGVTKRGQQYRFTLNQAMGYLYAHIYRYSEILDEIFKDLIKQSPYDGIPCIFNRNPTQTQGSAQRGFITKVKPKAEDTTADISDLCCTTLNACNQASLSEMAMLRSFN